MIRIVRWSILACTLLALSVSFISSSVLAQSACIMQDGEPFVIGKTTRYGVPAAYLEWDAHRLVKVEETYSFTGRSPVPFTGLSVGWLVSDHNADPRSFEVAIRTRKDEAPWTMWVHCTGDIRPDESPSGLFWNYVHIPNDFNAHTEFEITIRPPAGMLLTFVRVAVADNSAISEAADQSEPPREIDAIESSVVTALGAPAEPVIIRRADWLGAEHPWNVTQITITHAIIHHTVTPNVSSRTLSDSIQIMQEIRTHHMRRGWDDIGYNFVIDEAGRIFQGRHNPWFSTTDVWGAHAWDTNSRSVGIALMGQFQPGEPIAVGHPSAASLRSLERLLAWRFHQRTLDPLGRSNIRVTIIIGRNPDGSHITRWEYRNIHRIAGHRDVFRTVFVGGRIVPEVAATDCPGDNLQVLLPTIRANVRNLIPPRLHVSPVTVAGSLAPGVGLTTIGTVNVTNPGGGNLSWSATSNRAWLSVTPSSGTTTTETDSVSVRATAAGLLPGTYTGTITFTGASPAAGTPAAVNVTLTVTAAAPVVSPLTASE